MTIFVGENDSGKSTILRALDIFFNNKTIDHEMFTEINGIKSDESKITLVFELNEDENTSLPKSQIIDGKICISKQFLLGPDNTAISKIMCNSYQFRDEKLNIIESLKAPELRELCKQMNITYENVDTAKEKLKEYREENFDKLDKDIGWLDIRWTDISDALPTFELYDSSSYKDPQRLIENTLINVYRTYFYDYDKEGNESLKSDYMNFKKVISDELDKKIKDQLKAKVKSLNSKIKDLSGDFNIDFAKGFSLSSLLVDYGHGQRPINNIGEGSKKRLFLALMEWDKEELQRGTHRTIIRAYDEPDTSLHYKAQKELFYTLRDMTENNETNLQALICTHSISMIDRSAPQIINHLKSKDGKSSVDYLKHAEDESVKIFISKVSEISGIKNSSLFFERCFLIVEGQTEYNALALIYGKTFNKSFEEDGILLFNLGGNTQWENFLKLLGYNKQRSTLMFLDQDTQSDNSKKKITPRRLRTMGFDEAFFNDNVIFCGTKEFEDSFSNEIICRCMNLHCPKCDSGIWIEQDIESIRNHDKFSDELNNLIRNYKQHNNVQWDYFRKVDLGAKIAEVMTEEDIRNHEPIYLLLNKIQSIIE